MRKKLLVIISLALVWVTLVNVQPLYATNGETEKSLYAESSNMISPYFSNCNQYTFAFNILDPGEAHVNVSYMGKSEVFVQAKSTVKIQKKILGLFWTTVDIGETNNEWVEYSTDLYGDFYNYFEIDGSGTYRAVLTLEISGTDGSVDVVEETIEYKY